MMKINTIAVLVLMVGAELSGEAVYTIDDMIVPTDSGQFRFTGLEMQKAGRLTLAGNVSGVSSQDIRFNVKISDAKGYVYDYASLILVEAGSGTRRFAYDISKKINPETIEVEITYSGLAEGKPQQPPGGPWSAATLIDYTQVDGLRKGPLDDEWRDKKAFTFTLRFDNGVVQEFRKITGSLFDTTPSVVVNEGMWAYCGRYDCTLIDHAGRKHRVKLVKTIAAPK